MSSYFLLKTDLSLVKYENISNSGNCYLVSDIKTNKREWIMYYDLYKLVEKKERNYKWLFDENYDKKLRELISSL